MSQQEHKAVFTADNKDFNKKVDQVGQKGSWLVDKFKLIGGAIAAAFSVRAIVNFGREAVDLASKIQGVEEAFRRIADPGLLQDLRDAVKGTVSDMDLMTAAVKASNFKIPLNQLATFFEFARKRAQQTGESVDYLVNSIVLGIGRKSPLILDNLGISAIRLREKFGDLGMETADVGDVAKAMGEIVQEELVAMGNVADTTATKMQQLKSAWTNFKTSFGERIAESPALIRLLETLTAALNAARGEDFAGLSRVELLEKQAKLTEDIAGYEKDMKAQDTEIAGLKWYQFQRAKDLKFQAEGTWESYVKVKNELKKINELLAAIPPPPKPPPIPPALEQVITPSFVSPMPEIPDFLPVIPEEEIAATAKAINEDLGDIELAYTRAQLAAGQFGEEVMQSSIEGASGLMGFARVAVQVAKKIIATYLAEGVAAAVKGALTKVPFPFNIIAAGVAGGAAAALFNSLVPDFAAGGGVSGPTMALVGEAPGISHSNPEYIGTAKQLAQMGLGGRNNLRCEISRDKLIFFLTEGKTSFNNVF